MIEVPPNPTDGHRIVYWRLSDNTIEQFRITYYKSRTHAQVTGEPKAYGAHWTDEWGIEHRYIDSESSEIWRRLGRNSPRGMIDVLKDDRTAFSTFEEARTAILERLTKRIHFQRSQIVMMEGLKAFYFALTEPTETP